MEYMNNRFAALSMDKVAAAAEPMTPKFAPTAITPEEAAYVKDLDKKLHETPAGFTAVGKKFQGSGQPMKYIPPSQRSKAEVVAANLTNDQLFPSLGSKATTQQQQQKTHGQSFAEKARILAERDERERFEKEMAERQRIRQQVIAPIHITGRNRRTLESILGEEEITGGFQDDYYEPDVGDDSNSLVGDDDNTYQEEYYREY